MPFVSINQLDLEEKNNQVLLMRGIYSSAKLVLVWLGQSADDSNRAMNFIATLQKEIKKHNLHELDPHERSYVGQFPSFKEQDYPDWVAFRNLFQRRWFSRVWVIQEMVLSGRTILACGEELRTGMNYPTSWI